MVYFLSYILHNMKVKRAGFEYYESLKGCFGPGRLLPIITSFIHITDAALYHGCYIHDAALITWPTRRVPQFQTVVDTCVMTSVAYAWFVAMSSSLEPKWIFTAASAVIPISSSLKPNWISTASSTVIPIVIHYCIIVAVKTDFAVSTALHAICSLSDPVLMFPPPSFRLSPIIPVLADWV